MDNIGKFQKTPFSSSRDLVIDVVEQGLQKHHVKVLLELDVTRARQLLARYKEQRGESLSFTGWIAKCIAEGVSKNPQVHALRQGRSSMITFEDVDILVTVQKTIKGDEIPIPYVIRKVNEKSIDQINAEIRFAQSEPVVDGEIMIGANPWFAKIYLKLPKVIRSAIGRRSTRDPFFIKQNTGTVGISAVGMMGSFKGWAIPISPQPLYFSLGGIVKKPGVVNDKIEIREFLNLAFVFDHDVVDGTPVARFVSDLTSFIESGFGLPQDN